MREPANDNGFKLAGLISEADAAKLIGVSQDTLYRARKRGDVICAKIGRRVLYSPDQLEAFIARCTSASSPCDTPQSSTSNGGRTAANDASARARQIARRLKAS